MSNFVSDLSPCDFWNKVHGNRNPFEGHRSPLLQDEEGQFPSACYTDPFLNLAIKLTPAIILWASNRFDPDSTGKEFFDLKYNHWIKAEDLYSLYIKEQLK